MKNQRTGQRARTGHKGRAGSPEPIGTLRALYRREWETTDGKERERVIKALRYLRGQRAEDKR